MKLNLTAVGKEQELILAYLEENASDILATKINEGVKVEKDGKMLINKKTLDGFMAFAAKQAREEASKGANFACVEETVVFGWAIHYFEEDEITEKLYLEDGTEYKPAPKTVPKKIEPKKSAPKTKTAEIENGEQATFDFFTEVETVTDNEEITEMPEIEDEEEEIVETPPQIEVSPLYLIFKEYQEKYDEDTIILMKIGDFYEIFGKWAKRASEHLELTLVGRDLGLSERVPMVGIPYHRLDVYLPKMRELAPVVIYRKDEEDELHSMLCDYTKVDKDTGEVRETSLTPEQDECLRIIRNIMKEELEVSI